MLDSIAPMNTPIVNTAIATETDTIETWQDWFEATYLPFQVQACTAVALQNHAEFIRLQPLLQKRLVLLLQAVTELVATENLLGVHGLKATLPSGEAWELEWMLGTNAVVQAWNLQYREKDAPTDVLSFPTFDSDPLPAVADPAMLAFYQAQKQQGGSLGTIVVSWEYAVQAVTATNPTPEQSDETLIAYLLERFCHGCLHLLGVHHDTQAAYERVITLQANALERVKQL